MILLMGMLGENTFKNIDKFLEVVGLIKINGLTQDRFRLSVFPISLAGAASEWFTKECIGSITTWDNMVEKFIMKFHHLPDHDEEEESEEDDNPNETDNVSEIFKIEGNLFDFETPLIVGRRDSRGDEILRMVEKNFENFHELDYDVLTSDPYLDVNRIFGTNYEASNIGDTQENQRHEEHKGNPNPEPSNCKIRRFEMMKYSFNDDEEYIIIKESEYLNLCTPNATTIMKDNVHQGATNAKRLAIWLVIVRVLLLTLTLSEVSLSLNVGFKGTTRRAAQS
ncbi:hypothetical protein Tco_1057537 [Tanacetum coccineum]|uniref:Retrotransposon gag domain-containing protein n=1 Tax=Tanacetum coccineum TaxID=301880 RepID=A0ABQ5H5P8_9ASTR